MKKILVAILLGAVSAVSLDVGTLPDECLYKDSQSACQDDFDKCITKGGDICQKLLREGLPSVKECDNGPLCRKIGGVYISTYNYQQGFPYIEKGCDYKDSLACYFVGLMYDDGDKAVRQDFFKARQYYEKACDMGLSVGCNDLGILYATGKGVRKDEAKGKKYFGKACDMGSKSGCDNYRIANERGIK